MLHEAVAALAFRDPGFAEEVVSKP